MPTKSYAFAVGNVRAKETALLKKQDIEQMLALNSVSALSAFLKDKGFGFADTSSDIDELLLAEEQKVWKYAAEIAPDFSVFEPFIISNDFHNIKAVLKATLCSADYNDLLLYPTIVSPETVIKAVSEQKFNLLPVYMASAAEKAYNALFKIGDSQLCDAILDTAANLYKTEKANLEKIPMLKDLLLATVFYDNVKAAIRLARANKSADFCDICLITTGPVSKARLKEAALKGAPEVLNLLSNITAFKCAEAVEAYKVSPGEFERFVDNYLMSIVLGAKYVAVGAEPLVAYLWAKLAEIKVCRIIKSGIATGENGKKVREMLRELYG